MDEPPNPPKVARTKRVRWVTAGMIVLVVVAALVVFVGQAAVVAAWRETSNRLVCSANLKALGAAWMATPAPPASSDVSPVEWLLLSGTITWKQTICPSSGLSKSNYIFVTYPAGYTMDNKAIVIYEPKSNHDGVGGNFLYADGHVKFVRVPEYDDVVRSIEQHTH